MLGPNFPYFWSIAARISRRGFFSAFIAIASRVMLTQMSQVAAWLLYVMRPSACRSVT